MGIFGALTTAVDRHARAVLRAREYLRQHRQFADHRVQARRYQLRGLDPGQHPEQATGRQRGRKLARDQQRAGRHPERLGRHLHGDQRRRLLRRRKAGKLRRQQSGVRRHQSLHPARRFPDQQERLSGQRRRLLPDGHSDRPDDRQSGRQRAAVAAVLQRVPAGARHDNNPIPGQSGELSAHDQPRHQHSRVRTADRRRLRHRPDGRRHRHRGRQRRQHLHRRIRSAAARSPPTTSPARR